MHAVHNYTMQDLVIHSTPEQVPENPMELVLRGMSGILRQQELEMHHLRKQNASLEQQLSTPANTSVIAEGKQKEMIAVLNTLYASGLITNCTKSEFMQRMALALGVPDMANNYAKHLYNIKLASKYSDIFKHLAQVAQQELTKDN